MESLGFAELLCRCHQALDSSPVAEIPLGWRIRLWHRMNHECPESSLRRRSILAIALSSRTLRNWDNAAIGIDPEFKPLPHQLLRNCKRLVNGEINECEARQYDIHLVEAAMGLYESIGNLAWVPLSAFAAIQCASGYEEALCAEHYYPTVWTDGFVESARDDDDDWEVLDTHFWCACIAGGYPGLAGVDRDRRLWIWRDWLDSAVPSVLCDIDRANKLLEAC